MNIERANDELKNGKTNPPSSAARRARRENGLVGLIWLHIFPAKQQAEI